MSENEWGWKREADRNLRFAFLVVLVIVALELAWLILVGTPDSQANESANAGAYAQGDQGYAWWQYSGAWIAIFTVVLTVSTVLLWWHTRRLALDAERQFATANRAFVFLEDFGNQHSTTQRLGALRTFEAFSIVPKWKNSGNTQTKNLSMNVACNAFAGGFPADFDYQYQGEPLRTLVGPGANEWNAVITISPAVANKALEGTTDIYIWGRADYEDIFGGIRFTEFCSRICFIRKSDGDIRVQFVPHGPHNRTEVEQS